MRFVQRREFENETGERQVRFGLYLEDVVELEHFSELGSLYRFWHQAKAAPNGMRYMDVLDSLWLAPVATPDFVTVIGADKDASSDFYIVRPALKAAVALQPGQKISEIGSPLNRRRLTIEYASAKEEGRVLVDEIHQWFRADDGQPLRSNHYVRFIYPLCDRSGELVRFMVASRQINKRVQPLSSALQAPLIDAA